LKINFYLGGDILGFIYSGSRLDAVHFDLSPNLSPTRREALILTPLPLQGRGWGLGFSAVLHATEKCYRKFKTLGTLTCLLRLRDNICKSRKALFSVL
jgi:hypothetical protein